MHPCTVPPLVKTTITLAPLPYVLDWPVTHINLSLGKKSEEKDYNGRQSTEKDREEEREKVNEKDTNTKISETKTPSENDKTEETPMEQETKTPAAIESEGDSKYDAWGTLKTSQVSENNDGIPCCC